MSQAARCETPSRSLYDLIDAATKGSAVSVSEFFGKRVRIKGGNFTLETTISDVVLRLAGASEESNQIPRLMNIEFTFTETEVLVNKGRWTLHRTINHLSFCPSRTLSGHLLLFFKEDGHGDKEVYVELLE